LKHQSHAPGNNQSEIGHRRGLDLDETGLSNWEEQKYKPVIVPSDATQTPLRDPVDRGIRHHTLLCCISTSRDAYTPLLIAPRQSENRIFENGVRAGVDLKLEIRPSPYVDANLFRKYIQEMFLPAVATNRRLPGCKNQPAILFCDNRACHCFDAILKELAGNGVLVLTYSPHTSHIFQVLDLVLFGNLKRCKKYQTRDENEDHEVDHILRNFNFLILTHRKTVYRHYHLLLDYHLLSLSVSIAIVHNNVKTVGADLFPSRPKRSITFTSRNRLKFTPIQCKCRSRTGGNSSYLYHIRFLPNPLLAVRIVRMR
jgi:hypothetical protein